MEQIPFFFSHCFQPMIQLLEMLTGVSVFCFILLTVILVFLYFHHKIIPIRSLGYLQEEIRIKETVKIFPGLRSPTAISAAVALTRPG